MLPLDRCAEFPLRVASPALGSTTVKVEFSVLDGVEERRVFGSSCGCVQVLVNGWLGGYLIRDLSSDRGGRWCCSAWPHWPEGPRLQLAGLHGSVLSRDREDAQRFVLARLVPLGQVLARP